MSHSGTVAGIFRWASQLHCGSKTIHNYFLDIQAWFKWHIKCHAWIHGSYVLNNHISGVLKCISTSQETLLWISYVPSWSAYNKNVILFAYILFREITIHCVCKCYNSLLYSFLFTRCFYPTLWYRKYEFTWRVDSLSFLAFMNKLFMPLYVLQ